MPWFGDKAGAAWMAGHPAWIGTAFRGARATLRRSAGMHYLLFAAFSVVAAVPVITLAVWFEHRAVQQEVDAAWDKHLLIARNLTAAVSRYVTDMKAGFDLAINGLNSGDQALGLKDLLKSLEYRHICIINGSTGVVERSMPGFSDPTNIATTIKPERLTDFHEELKKGGIVLTNLKYAQDGKPAFFLLRQLPEGRIALGVVGTDYLIQLQRAIAFGAHGHAAILDGTARVIAHPFQKWIDSEFDLSKTPPGKAIIAGQTGVMQFFSPAFNADMITGYAVVPETGWGIMVPQPMSELYAQAGTARNAAFSLALLCLTAAAIGSWCLARFISRPLEAIGNAAGAIARGDDRARAPRFAHYVPKELHELSGAFNRMVDELSRINRELSDTAARAAAANRAKSEFLANMSHELRTPLNAIHGFSEIMRDELLGPIGSSRYRGYAADIANSSTHLISVIDAILNLAKAEAGKITLEIGPVKLPEVFELSVRLIAQAAAEKSITIGVELSRYLARHAIMTDQGKLTQILVNLLTNSTKFTEPGGSLWLIGERRGENVTLIVRDSGVGIAAEDLDGVMTPFGQVARADCSHDGFGLGLPMTKKLAEALGGTFTLESELGEGTTVTIELPLVVAEQPDRTEAPTINQAA